MKNILIISLFIAGLIVGYSVQGNIDEHVEVNSCSYRIIIKE